jgi:hypothetical protein
MRRLLVTAIGSLTLAAGSTGGTSAASLRRVALSGDTVPGTGSFLQGFNSIVINARGDAAVLGWTTANEYVLVADYGAGMVLVGEGGTQAPGAPLGLELHPLNPSSIADDGCVLVPAGLQQGTSGVVGQGVWLFEPGVGLTPYLRNGDPAPGMAGTLTLIGNPTMSPSGRFVLLGGVDSGLHDV